jgi:hypothetical protein
MPQPHGHAPPEPPFESISIGRSCESELLLLLLLELRLEIELVMLCNAAVICALLELDLELELVVTPPVISSSTVGSMLGSSLSWAMVVIPCWRD